MDNNKKGKVIKLVVTKEDDDKKETNLSEDVNVINIRKNQIDKMIEDIASLNKSDEEDLLEM